MCGCRCSYVCILLMLIQSCQPKQKSAGGGEDNAESIPLDDCYTSTSSFLTNIMEDVMSTSLLKNKSTKIILTWYGN